MIQELLSIKKEEKGEGGEGGGAQTNHFVRISNSILFLEFIEEDLKTGFTIIKNDRSPTPPSDKNIKTFYPYSTWHYYNFTNV